MKANTSHIEQDLPKCNVAESEEHIIVSALKWIGGNATGVPKQLVTTKTVVVRRIEK